MVNITSSVTVSAGLYRNSANGNRFVKLSRTAPSSVRFFHYREDSGSPLGNSGRFDGMAVFLASDASDFVNGHVLYVDGGILAYIGKQP